MIFYLLIFGNYISDLLPKRLQAFMSSSIIARHLIGLFTLIFFVVLSERSLTSGKLDITSVLGKSLIAYAVFMISSRSNLLLWGVGTILLLVYYVIDLYEKEHRYEEDRTTGESLNLALRILGPLILSCYVLGFVMYLSEKRNKLGGAFRLHKFIFGT